MGSIPFLNHLPPDFPIPRGTEPISKSSAVPSPCLALGLRVARERHHAWPTAAAISADALAPPLSLFLSLFLSPPFSFFFFPFSFSFPSPSLSLSLLPPTPRARPLLPLCSRASPGRTASPPLHSGWPGPLPSLSLVSRSTAQPRPRPTAARPGRAPPAGRVRTTAPATAAWPLPRAQHPAVRPRSPLPTTRPVDGRSPDPHAHTIAPAHSAGDHGTVPPAVVSASRHLAFPLAPLTQHSAAGRAVASPYAPPR